MLYGVQQIQDLNKCLEGELTWVIRKKGVMYNYDVEVSNGTFSKSQNARDLKDDLQTFNKHLRRNKRFNLNKNKILIDIFFIF